MRISDWSSDVCSSDLRVRYWSSGSAYVSGCGKTASKKRKTTAPEGRRPGHRRCDVASERRAHRRHADRAVVGNVRLQAGAALLARPGFVRLHEPLLVQRLAAAGLDQRIGGRGQLLVRAAVERSAESRVGKEGVCRVEISVGTR